MEDIKENTKLDNNLNEINQVNFHKEIDLIQSCISRMANNSFLVKGWSISIVAIIFTLSEKNINPLILSIPLVVSIFIFWCLDSFYLLTERKYQKLYDWIIVERPKGNYDYMYNLNSDRLFKDEEKSETIFNVMVSKTLINFYGIFLFIVILIIGITFYNNPTKVVKKNNKEIKKSSIYTNTKKTKRRKNPIRIEQKK
jgi:hypothetical protein